MKTSFKNKRKLKTYLQKKKWKIYCQQTFTMTLKELLQAQEYDDREKFGSIKRNEENQ